MFGIGYLHLQLEDGSDLYVTDYGLPFTRHLLPENHWADKDWFADHSVKLPGTGSLYRITTKQVAGISKGIVLKWNRMGQDIPGETEASELATAQFNSPFEEFSLVSELRNSRYESPGQICTHKPLAIFVPRRYVEADRMGRRQYVLDAIQRTHTEVTLDLHRQYAVIYEWVKGIDAAEAFRGEMIDENTMRGLVLRANQEMMHKGFLVRDSKPHHIIIRPNRDGRITRDRRGEIIYALIDFELLERTPRREQTIRGSKRKSYLVRQAHRFQAQQRLPPGLTQVTIMGVDYVYGQVESTGGRLWVVGKDPLLFDYFLPEKWRRTPRTWLSGSHQVYHTVTKDNIHLVWRVSNVGRRPDIDNSTEKQECAHHGYNSPFEEFSLSMQLTGGGIETTYPRAIYMTGHKIDMPVDLADNSRYESHQGLRTPDGHPILGKDHDFMTIWGFWNGPDEALAARDEEVYKGINALDALKEGFVTQEMYDRVMQATGERLAAVGIEDLDFRGNHLLLSLDTSGQLAMNDQGVPTVRVCNFELLRRTGP